MISGRNAPLRFLTALLLTAGTLYGDSSPADGESFFAKDGEPLRLMLLPFVKDDVITDFEYEQVSSAFHLAVSRRREFDVVSRLELIRILQKTEDEEGPSLDKPDSLYDLAEEHDVDLLIFGAVGALQNFELRGMSLRTVGIKVEIASVERRQVFNQVAWSTSHVTGGGTQQGDRIALLSGLAANKLMWLAPDFYPVNVSFDSFVQHKPEDYELYKNRVRGKLNELKLPPGSEIDLVEVQVRERQELAPTGVVGCLTLVGWLFLPYYEVSHDVNLQIRLKTVSANGVQFDEFNSVANSSELYHISASDEKKSRPSIGLLDNTLQDSVARVRKNRGAFEDRSAILRKFYRKPENEDAPDTN